MKHGGDLISYKDYYQGELVDYSSNINPIGPPQGLKEKILENFHSIEAYPDIKYRELKRSLSEYLGSSEENILVGNGAVEIIDIFTNLAERVVLMTPCFGEYEERALVHKKEVLSIPYREDFSIDLDKLKENLKEGDLLILGNPNNPDGLRIEKNILLDLYKLVRKRQAKLLLDEAFFEFVPKDYDSLDLFREYNYESIGIIRAATKFFAIPGLRLGYGVTSLKLKEEVKTYQLPWSVNALANIAGQYIFEDKAYIKNSKDYIEAERNYMLGELNEIPGISPYKTHTNYILIKLLKYNEEYIFERLLKEGFLIRKCRSFKELGDNHIRIAIKDRKNNEKIIEAIKKHMRGEYLDEKNC